MLVSVYIPTRNRLELLRGAVASVLAQTHADIDLVVVDDGSEDGTPGYLRELGSTDHRVRHFRNPTPRGAPACRNLAIRAAAGDFVTGLDDDDTFEPFRIESFVQGWKTFERSGQNTAFLFSQENWFRDGLLVYTSQKRGSVEADDMPAGNQVGNQIFAPKSAFLEAGLFDESLPAWQDMDLFIRILRRFGVGRLVDVASYRFDVTRRPDRISAQTARVKAACDVVASRHFPDNRRQRQQLTLQVFNDFYGFRPTFDDVFRFAMLGFWPRGLLQLLRATVRA